MLRIVRRTLLAAAVAASLGAFVAPAMADTQWQKEHPRREQVNNRLANQNRRIKQERREGEITKGQAKQLHHEDHAIRQEERSMAHTNNSHVTKAEQRALNQQENQVSRQIGK